MLTQEIVAKIESLRNDYSDGAVNYLQAIGNSIGFPPQYVGCFCKESARIEFSKRFYMWYDEMRNSR